jgi:ElaB/YqjD/DUF883 family membrane-anchored ribosome-binding protein
MGEAPDAIREDIELTRARMGERAEALAYKADVPARSKDKVHDVTDRIKEKVTGMGDRVSGTSQSAKGRMGDKAHAASDQVSDKAHRAKGLAESNPLGLAVGAIAAGFLVGLAVPVTRAEQQHLGPIADQARDKVREVGQEVGDRAREVAHATEESVKEQVHS